jgi:hypothetical protein
MMHFDGSGWSIVAGPPGGTALAAVGPNDVWVSDPSWGYYYHWDGAAWTSVPAPATTPGAWFDSVSAMTVAGPCDVWGVGSTYYDSGESRTLAQRLLGSAATPADLNCDGLINFFDIDPFILALFDPTAYAASFPACDIAAADTNGDAAVNFFDIDPFVACLFAACP